MPRARISATGAMPEPSLRFEPGQCITLTSRSASSACSALGDPDAVRGAQARRRQARVGEVLEVREPAGQPPDDLDLVADLRRVGVHERLLARPTAPRPLRAARASTTPRSAARTPRAAGRWPRRPSAASAPGSRRSTPCVCSCSRARHVVGRVHHALADDRAQPARPTASRTRRRCRGPSPSSARSWCRCAAAPRRPAAPRRAASTACAPLPSARPARFSHSSSGMSSANPRKSVWHRWTWVWMKPGRR